MPPAAAQLKTDRVATSGSLALAGRLDASSVATLWDPLQSAVTAASQPRIVLDASGVEYCDGAGAALLLGAQAAAKARGAELAIEGLKPDFETALKQFDVEHYLKPPVAPAASTSLIEQIGANGRQVWKDFLDMAEFTGEFARAMGYALRHPGSVRWQDAIRTAEVAGANALPVVLLVGFLIGFVMAFQAAIPMRQFGADAFIPTLVGLAMCRELGPIMTALALAGRSSSAFAAELGTMKVNDEIAALTTLGLSPVPFLVVPRVIAAVLMTPVLTVFGTMAGILGGLLVFVFLGYPVATYWSQMSETVGLNDFLGGMAKGFFFGIVVAGIGCLRGLQTKTGASAVGDSTTSAVVSCIVFVSVGDGLFALLYYALGI